MSWDRRDTATVMGLLLAPFAYYWRLIVPGAGRHYFESGDFVDQFYAFAHFEAASLAAGKLPLWNPFAFSGSPFWADVQSAVAYPPSLAVVLASLAAFGRLPFLALELEAVAHLALAGTFTYLFARRVVGCRSGAAVAALTFALGGYLTGYPVLQLAVLESNAWLPLALLGVVLLSDGRAWVGMATVAVATGMGVLSGHPQSAMYLIALTAFYAIWRLWPITFGARRQPGDRAVRSATIRPWVMLAGGLALGFGLSAAGWLPALEYTQLSNRAAADYATVSHGFPPRELVGVLVPGLTKWSPLYVGVLPLLLAVAAVLRSFGEPAATAGVGSVPSGASGVNPHREGRFWAVAAATALLLSLGGRAFLFDMFYLLAPGFDMFRGQERSAFLFSFSLAVLAGLGFAAWRRCDAGRPLCSADRVVMAGALVIAVLGMVVAVAAASDPQIRMLGIHMASFAGAAGLLAFARSKGHIRTSTLTASALALIAFDLYLVGSSTNLQPDAPGELHSTEVIEAMKQSDGFVRVQNEDRLPRNFGVLHEIRSTYGASPMRPQAYDTLRDGLAGGHEAEWRDVAAVSHVLTAEQEIGGPDATNGGVTGAEGTVHELEPTRPYAWFVVCAETVTDDAKALEMLADPDPALRYARAYLHPDGSPDTDDSDTNELGSCELLDGTSNEPFFDYDLDLRSSSAGLVQARTSSTVPGWMVVSEGYYPGWRAEVDGKPVVVSRANVAFMAVPVPEGSHELRLWFTAPLVGFGLAISLLSAAAIGTAVLLGRRGRDTNGERQPG